MLGAAGALATAGGLLEYQSTLRAGAEVSFHLGTSEPQPVGLASREALLGHHYTNYHDYMGSTFGAHTFKHPDRYNLLTISSGAPNTKNPVQNVLNGSLDSAIQATSDSITEPTDVAVWQEPNGHWEGTNAKYIGGASNYVKAWRHVAGILLKNSNITLVWSPNIKTYSGVDDPALYWPGDDIPFKVLVDGYCKNGYKTPDFLFDTILSQYGPGSKHNRVFGIAETAAAKDSSPEKYIPALQSWLAAHSGISVVYWFDNTNTAQGWTYGVDSTPQELAAYKTFCTKAAA